MNQTDRRAELDDLSSRFVGAFNRQNLDDIMSYFAESAVYEERCYALSVDADHDCCEASWDEYWSVESMDGVCKNDAY